jgi:hypothetical protein
VASSLIRCELMSKQFRSWKIDECQLLPPSVLDYVPKENLSRLIVALVREELDLSALRAATGAGWGSRRLTLG